VNDVHTFELLNIITTLLILNHKLGLKKSWSVSDVIKEYKSKIQIMQWNKTDYKMDGMKETTCFSLIMLNKLCIFWKKSNLLHFSGSKLKMFIFLLVIICGGSNPSFVWVLVDCLFLYYFMIL